MFEDGYTRCITVTASSAVACYRFNSMIGGNRTTRSGEMEKDLWLSKKTVNRTEAVHRTACSAETIGDAFIRQFVILRTHDDRQF